MANDYSSLSDEQLLKLKALKASQPQKIGGNNDFNAQTDNNGNLTLSTGIAASRLADKEYNDPLDIAKGFLNVYKGQYTPSRIVKTEADTLNALGDMIKDPENYFKGYQNEDGSYNVGKAYFDHVYENRNKNADFEKAHPIASSLRNGLIDGAGFTLLTGGKYFPVKFSPTNPATYLPALGASLGNAGIDAGIPGFFEALSTGENPLSGFGTGTAIGAGIQAVLSSIPLVGKALSGVKDIAIKTARLKPETIEQAVKPNSIALDLTADGAQNLLLDTTQKVRNAYADLLSQRGQAVGDAVDNLPKGRMVSINQLDKDLRDVYDTYSKTGDKELNKAYKYVGKEYDDIKESLNAARRPQTQIDRENFQTDYQDFLNGTLNPRQELQILSETPDVWMQQGLPNNKIMTNQNALRKMGDIANIYDKNHNLDKQIINNLPDLLYDPNYILKSDTVNGRYMGILDALDSEGKPVAAILAPNEKNMGVTFVPSAYGRNNFNNFIQEQAEKGNVLYSKGVRSPQVPATIAGGDTYTPKDIISQLPENDKISGQRLYDIIKTLPETDFKSPDAKLKDEVLRQVYGKYSERLSELSPELAEANKAYSDLMDFKTNDAVNQILNGDLYKEGKIANAPTALKNYRANITSGNKAKNVYELENILHDNGYGTFTDKIDDINAAQNLLHTETTGDSSISNVVKGKVVRPVLETIRNYNRSDIPRQIQMLQFKLKPLTEILAPVRQYGAPFVRRSRVPIIYANDDN